MISKIGVIGGGQLGRMFALDAKRMGYYVITLDPQEHSPCGQVSDEQIVAQYDDLDAVLELGRRSDVVTYEFENINIESVQLLERKAYYVTPASDVLRVTQDRLLEKEFVRTCGIATADFAAIRNSDDLTAAVERLGYPGILKIVRGGYDGKGQWRVRNAAEAADALREAGGTELIWERVVPFEREISVVATRDSGDCVVTYPVAENAHDRGILTATIAPARIDDATSERARDMAATIGRNLRIVGTYCVEMFALPAGELLVNEIAPRPHNSGHYSIDVTPCSQYEQHVRAICGLPLSPPALLRNAIMRNILGTGTGDVLRGVPTVLADPAIVLHVYGKRHAVERRKMGHFTMLVDGTVDEAAIARADAAHAALRWEPT